MNEYLKTIAKIVGTTAVLLLCGCADTSYVPYSETVNSSPWVACDGGAPLSWRITQLTGTRGHSGSSSRYGPIRSRKVEIRNGTNQKIYVAGLLTANPHESFINLDQQGAFKCEISPHGIFEQQLDNDGPIYLKIQDTMVSD